MNHIETKGLRNFLNPLAITISLLCFFYRKGRGEYILQITKFAQGINKYIAEDRALIKIGKLAKVYGKKAMIVGGSTALSVSQARIIESLEVAGVSSKIETYGGKCSINEINDFTDNIRQYKPDLIIGVGGGKVLDFVKAIGYYNKIPVFTVPTIAATCTAWTPTSVIYSKEGVPAGGLETNSPEYILVDMEILRSSPRRYFAAGLVDSLAKWPELGLTEFGSTDDLLYQSGIKLSQFILENCLELVEKIEWYSQGEISGYLDRIVEINIPITGICSELTAGAMTGGQLPAVAHAVDEALLATNERSHQFCHGERVSFGLIPHMIIFQAEENHISRVIEFCLSLDLPIDFESFALNPGAIASLANRTTEVRGMRGSGITPVMIEKALYESQEKINVVKEKQSDNTKSN